MTVVPFKREVVKPTFICADCEVGVFDFTGQVRERCLTCQWIADIEDPVERETLRRLYQELR